MNKAVQDMERALRLALDNVRPDAYLEAKSMFGGVGFFVSGRMFAAWFGAGLAIKLPDAAQYDLLQVDGASITQTRQYIEVPQRFIDDPAHLEPWVARSVEYVQSLPIKKRKKAD